VCHFITLISATPAQPFNSTLNPLLSSLSWFYKSWIVSTQLGMLQHLNCTRNKWSLSSKSLQLAGYRQKLVSELIYESSKFHIWYMWPQKSHLH